MDGMASRHLHWSAVVGRQQAEPWRGGRGRRPCLCSGGGFIRLYGEFGSTDAQPVFRSGGGHSSDGFPPGGEKISDALYPIYGCGLWNSIMPMTRKGVYTVEAVIVMSISNWVLTAICYCGLYVHDMVVLESVTNGEAASWLSAADPTESASWCRKIRKELDKKLFLTRIQRMETRSVPGGRKIQIRYVLPISGRLMKKVLMKGEAELVYETVREHIVPAKKKWDREVFRSG